MPDQNLPINMNERQFGKSLDDLKKKDRSQENVSLNEEIRALARSATPAHDMRLSPAVIDSVAHNLSLGLPLEACCACAHVLPKIMKNWLRKGKEEICNLTDEQMDGELDLMDVLSPYGQLFMRVYESKGMLMSEILEAIHDKMYETHNEWLLTYMLERLDPETYNLKYKALKESSEDKTAGTQNFVQVQFINGLESRPKEEKEFIETALNQLKVKYSDRNEGLKNITPNTPEE